MAVEPPELQSEDRSVQLDGCLQLFEYHPLGKDEIRVCRVSSVKPLECELVNISIKTKDKDRHIYAALSYVWGEATATKPILCNGQILHVTKSLEEAMCGVHVHNDCDYIWIDQICINQANVDERNNQVQNMARIYQGLALQA